MLLTQSAVDPLRATSPSSILISKHPAEEEEEEEEGTPTLLCAGGLTALHVGAAFSPRCVGAVAFLKVVLACTPASLVPELLRATDSEGHCALALAARAGNADALRLLLDAAGVGTPGGLTALQAGLHPAARDAGSTREQECRAAVGLDAVNCDGDAPLHLAVRATLMPSTSCRAAAAQRWKWHQRQQRSVSSVLVLLQAGANALQWDAGGLTPLHVGLVLGTKHDHRQPQSDTAETPLSSAAAADDNEVDALLDSVSEALSLAFARGTSTTAGQARPSDAGPSAATALCLNARTESGLPPTHLAAAAGRALALRALVAAGADVRALSAGERLCLFRAGARGLRNAAAALARVRAQAELVASRGGRSDGTLLPLMSLLRSRRRALHGQLQVAKLLVVMPAPAVASGRDRRNTLAMAAAPSSSLALDSDRLDSTPLDTAVEAVAFMHQFVGECEQQQQQLLLQEQWERECRQEAAASDDDDDEPQDGGAAAAAAIAHDAAEERDDSEPGAAAPAARHAASPCNSAGNTHAPSSAGGGAQRPDAPRRSDCVLPQRDDGAGDKPRGWRGGAVVNTVAQDRWLEPNRSQLESTSLRLALDEARATAREWLAKRAGQRKLASDAIRLCADRARPPCIHV